MARRTFDTALAGMAGAVCLSALLAASGSAPVADAAMARDHEEVKSLLRGGADVNAAQGDGMTALHWAATQGDAALARMLLHAGANVRATTRLGGYTALHLSCQGGHAEIAQRLIDAGAGTDARTATGATPLMLASATGSEEAVGVLLAGGADANATEAAHGQTALMFAAALDRHPVVRRLVQAGADTRLTSSVRDVSGLRAPEDALQEEIRIRTTRAGGRAETPQPPPGPEIPGVTRPFTYNELIGRQGGLSALHFAARQGAFESVRALVDAGADVNQASSADGMTPLLVAAINGQFDIAAHLLERGADPNAASAGGVTPLYAVLNVHWAPRSFYPQPRGHLQQRLSYLEMMTMLLDRGANPNARLARKLWYMQFNFDLLRIDESGATPFWRAAYASDIDAMRLLVARGADPGIPTIKPAKREIMQGGTRGVDENRDHSGLPPLPIGGPGIPPLLAAAGVGYGEGFAGNAHRYAPTGMLAAVKYLVEVLEVDVNAVDHDGNTALHHAAARGDNEMIRYLVSRGADVTRVNRGGQTTVDMANGPVQRIQPFPETIKLLESLGAKNNHRCVSC